MSLQGFVNLRMVMIKAEYPKVYQYLHKEKQKHLESLAIEGKIIFHRLRRNVARMLQMGKLLRRMYGELKEMCLKADVPLIQVRTEEGDQGAEHQPGQRSFISTEVCIPFDLRYLSGSKVQILPPLTV